MLVAQVVAAAALAGWAWLALLRGGYWRTDIRLPEAANPTRWPTVAAIVPARDEAAVLPITMPSLLGQHYGGDLHVYVADDSSTDGTGALIARDWPEATVVDPGEPPNGWTGKLWALQAGITRASGDGNAAAPDYFLLTDADIAHRPSSLSALVRAAESGGYAMVSQMARLRSDTAWERLVVPAFVYFFALLFPFRWISQPSSRTAAAAGGCILIRRDTLAALGGLHAIRGDIIDDVALAKAVKRAGGRVFLGLGDEVDSVRAYPRLSLLWSMVSRSAYAQLNHSLPILAGTVAGLALMFWVPPAALVGGLLTADPLLAVLGLAGYGLMTALFVPMIRYYRLPWRYALTLPFTATLYLAMTVTSALAHYRGSGGAWKGRTYHPSQVQER